MIIDTHTHYSTWNIGDRCDYLCSDNGMLEICTGSLEDVFQKMQKADIQYVIESGCGVILNKKIAELAATFPGRVFSAVGMPPRFAMIEPWKNRKKLDQLAKAPGVVAIGETGLDYTGLGGRRFFLHQMFWFLHQLRLADRLQLPLILHVQGDLAHKDVLRILKMFPGLKGGVVSNFSGDLEQANEYLSLGFYLGISGLFLSETERGMQAWDVLLHAPLEKILIESSAPRELPKFGPFTDRDMRWGTQNTSLLIPDILKEIARTKHLTVQKVEEITARNAVALFGLSTKT